MPIFVQIYTNDGHYKICTKYVSTKLLKSFIYSNNTETICNLQINLVCNFYDPHFLGCGSACITFHMKLQYESAS